MAEPRDEELEYVLEDCRRRQRHPRAPQPISEIMSRLLSRRGYAQIHQAAEIDEALKAAVGKRMENDLRAGQNQRGILSVTVRNSAVMQELTFQKRRLLKKVQAALPQYKIHDIRLRIGEID